MNCPLCQRPIKPYREYRYELVQRGGCLSREYKEVEVTVSDQTTETLIGEICNECYDSSRNEGRVPGFRFEHHPKWREYFKKEALGQ